MLYGAWTKWRSYLTLQILNFKGDNLEIYIATFRSTNAFENVVSEKHVTPYGAFYMGVFQRNDSIENQFRGNYLDGLVQGRRNSIADALELRLSCTKPSISADVEYKEISGHNAVYHKATTSTAPSYSHSPYASLTRCPGCLTCDNFKSGAI